MLLSGFGASGGLLACVAWMGERLLPPTGRAWVVVSALSLVGQIAGQSLIAYALAHLSMAFSAVAILVQPVVAATLAWLLLGESLLPVQLAGGLLILAGIAVARPRSLSKR
jgi:drug/metabolite transporter (DMT)-like permease